MCFAHRLCFQRGFANFLKDDQDFPPLAPPVKAPAALPTPRSGIHSVQSSQDSSIRASTPRIPPGLSLPHAHPSPSFAEDIEPDKREPKPTPGPVTPALPILRIGNRTASPRPKVKETQEAPKLGNIHQDASFPKPSQVENVSEEKLSTFAAAPAHNGQEATTGENSPANAAADESAQRERPVHARKAQDAGKQSFGTKASRPPGKLDISAALEPKSNSTVSPSQPVSQVLPQSLVATPTGVASIPSTPTPSTTKSPDWSSVSRPRTLRLTTTTTTPKSEAAPASAVTERSTSLSAAVLKQASRQPSLSSFSRSRPSTPTASEHGTSNEISRAGSPPGSDIVGSAHERNKSKSQTKKERKVKAKTIPDSKDDESVNTTPPISEEVGPIISRQKKKRKPQDKSSHVPASGIAGSGPEAHTPRTAEPERPTDADSQKMTKESSSTSSRGHSSQDIDQPKAKTVLDKAQAERKSSSAPQNITQEPVLDSTPRQPYTLNDLFNDAAKLPETENALSELLNASISATSKLLQELFQSKDLDVNSSLLNAPSLTSYKLPSDSRKGADYLEANGYTMTSPFGELYLSGRDRKQLLQGQDVRVSDPNKPQNVLKRAMITPTGAIFRHLSAEEEEKVVELENRIRENEEKYGITGKMDVKPLDDMDFMNLTGGLQELMAFPPLHRISLLTAEPGTEGAEDDDVDFEGNASDETEDDMAPLASGFGAAPEGPMRKPMTPNTMKRKAEALMAVNLRNLDVNQLQKRIRETQVEMEGARKEMDALEKKAARKAKEVAKWREALLKDVAKGLASI
jgi:CCR4-NOT transcription complex subunit 4